MIKHCSIGTAHYQTKPAGTLEVSGPVKDSQNQEWVVVWAVCTTVTEVPSKKDHKRIALCSIIIAV